MSSGLVVDTRPILEYQQSHIPGSLSIAFRLSFATWLGWLVEIGTPLLFVVGDGLLERVIEESLLVGHENFAGWLTGGMEAWERTGSPTRETRSIGPDEAKRLLQNGALPIDVREPSEFETGHLDQAMNLPLGRLANSCPVIPEGAPVIAYCGHGERSTTAISLLEKSGVEAWNLDGGYDAWQ